jgi:ribosomal protein S18 acetylase RimI-like enzyme
MTVVVRRASSEDARAIADLALKLVIQHEEYNPKRFARLANSEQMANFYGSQTKAREAVVLVAEVEGKIVGFAFIQFDAKNYADLLESAAWLHDIYVDESARGLEAGKNLLEKAIEAAKELGASKLMLSVASQNQNAKGFFEHRGFKVTMVEMMLGLTDKKDND